MMQINGIVLGHIVSQIGIKFDPAKIEIISKISVPTSQKEVKKKFGACRVL